MLMIVEVFTVGRFFTNCYVVGCEDSKEAIIIDPGFDAQLEAERVYKFIDGNGLALEFIVNTHGHPDHTCGNGIVKKRFHIPILIHEYDAQMLGKSSKEIRQLFEFKNLSPPAEMLLHDRDVVKFGKIALRVIHSPGHSRGSISLQGEKAVFTGDTLFAGSIGRTDFPESSRRDMMLSLRKLASLPAHLVVYPGHGPITTIGQEKCSNPFLQFM